MKIAFQASSADHAQEAIKHLAALYGNVALEDADVIVALGGDGFMLQMLHDEMNTGRLVYGMNRGTIGFLMNDYDDKNLIERIDAAVENIIHPLEMKAVNAHGDEFTALAINEVSLLRQSYQAAKIKVYVDNKPRLEALICDGVMVATPAGSTAYNLSAHGPILPLDARLLAMTPVSPFRPRRWRGALLQDTAKVKFEIVEPNKRPVNAVADHLEVKSVTSVEICQSENNTTRILTDSSHSWNDRILAEQFAY
ncbi:MAG: NAD kinase [Rhizobiaceae bacterium]|nr:NAD kinase [Rhizobiaceae bacterium]